MWWSFGALSVISPESPGITVVASSIPILVTHILDKKQSCNEHLSKLGYAALGVLLGAVFSVVGSVS